MRKKAFTLAELLVALGIVGVIAALTLPSLMNMKQEASAGPQLSKVKASVEDAASRILLEDPSKNLKEYTDFTGKMSEYLVMSTAEGGGYRLKDGVVIDFEEATGGNVSNASGSAFKKVNVDLNGTSKPNVAGVDKFEFLLSTQGLLVPQGCAAKLASNNWKVGKDYDSATCSSYTMGGTIADTVPDEEEYTPEGTKTCPDGTVIPSYLSCESNPDCTPIACGCGESWSALDCACKPTPGFTKTCTGGDVWSETDCKCESPEPPACTPKTCTGGKIWSQADCDCVIPNPPACTPKSCDPLSDFVAGSICDCVKTRKDCGDGVIIGINEDCPKAEDECLPPRVMINGKCDYKPICNRFTEYYDEATNTCIAYTCCKNYSQKLCTPCYKTCPNGSQIDIRDGECPVTCERKACNELQEWDEANCTCHTNKIRCEDGSIIAFGERCPQKCSDGSYVPWGESCPVVCKKKTCTELQTWDESSCSCVTTKRKCSDGSIVGINDTCPTICKSQTCGCGQEWNPVRCACETAIGFKKSCSNELQTWDESSCSCVTTKKKCSDGSIVALNATCPVVCKVQTCNDVEVWDAKACKCFVVKKKCDDGSTVGINESCPRYCCDCDRPGSFGHRCLEGNSTTPYCGNACPNSGPKKPTSPDYGGHWEESNDLDMSERGNRTELAPLPSYNR